MNHIEAMKLWLAALEVGLDYAEETTEHFHIDMAGYKQHRHDAMDAEVEQIKAAIIDIRQAIEQAEQAQPKLTKTRVGNHLRRHMLGDQPTFRQGFKEGVAFAQKYTAPPPRQPWVGLTDEEVINVMPDDNTPISLGEAFSKFADLIEAKLKEKNT